VQKYKKYFIYASTRVLFIKKYTFFVKKYEKTNFLFSTFNFYLYLCTLI